MRLCHRTDQRGKEGIEAQGFRHKDPSEGGPALDAVDRGYAWFASSKEVARTTCWRVGWWVWIEVPDRTPEYEPEPGLRSPGNHRLRMEYVNSLPRTYEKEDEGA